MDEYEDNARISHFVDQVVTGEEIITSSISFPGIPGTTPPIPIPASSISIPPFPISISGMVALYGIKGIVGLGPAASVTFLPGDGAVCIGGGVGGGTTGVNGGPLVFGPIDQAQSVSSGLGVSLDIQTTGSLGSQIIVSPGNTAGALAGPTIGSPGVSVSITLSMCFGGN